MALLESRHGWLSAAFLQWTKIKLKRYLVFVCISVTVLQSVLQWTTFGKFCKSKILSLHRLTVNFLKFQNSHLRRVSGLHITVHLKLQIVILPHALHKTLENNKLILVKSNLWKVIVKTYNSSRYNGKLGLREIHA